MSPKPKEMIRIGAGGGAKSRTNQLTTASAITEKAERLQNTQNRIGTKRHKKSKLQTDHCLSGHGRGRNRCKK
jgi:hypothetical protein